jgi:CRISPR system Cascade subunit CasC
MEAAAQVAHAIAVHKCQVEDDYFTAVDDLNTGEEDRGSAHIGETEFGAALFYLYICVNRALLLENLNGDRTLADKTLEALLECTATVAPNGKQNSFAARAYASYILAEKGDRQPRSLSVAFLKPVEDADMLTRAIKNLEDCRDRIAQVYDACASTHAVMNAHQGEGSLRALKDFVSQD